MLNSSGAYARKEALPKPIFKLTQGQGTEVCEAYLQRLNATEFLDNDPTLGRISEPLLKGFADLKTVPLTAEEIQRLYYKIRSFEQYQDQNLLEKYRNLHKDEAWIKQQDQRLPKEIKQTMDENQKTPFVRYQATLDLDNDGFPSNTVIKNNNGVYIVDHQLQQIDEARMKAIFADQEILDWPTVVQFPPLAASINVFSYNGKTYFDGLLDVILVANFPPRVYRYVPVMLGVFIHENYQTRQVCEYQWVNGEVYQHRPYPGYK
ncbi:MAG: hypothetical protein QX199_11910 [Methylococcaceae bacterium]